MSRQGTPQQRLQAGFILAASMAFLLLLPINAAAAEQVGRVLVAVGSVTAEQEDASTRALGRRDPIYAGDRIRTAARGRVQIRFEDGAMVDLDPSSTFEVEEYASEDEDGGGSAVMSFLKGAMRTITGAIGGNRDDTYRMNTTVATIGVRGTAYALEYCDAECAGEDGEVGLYGRVDDGDVEVDGPGGTGTFGKGHYFFVPESGAPERIVAPPDGILEGEGETGAGGDDDRIEDVSINPLDTGEEDGFGLGGNDTDLLDPDFESSETTDLGELSTGIAGFGAAFGGRSDLGAFSDGQLYAEGGPYTLDSDGRLISGEFEDPFLGLVNIATDDVVLAESGTNTSLRVDWGRWNGNFVDGDSTPYVGNMAFATTDNLTEAETLTAMSGTLSYTLSDGPGAFDQDGDPWNVDSLALAVDFDAVSIGLTEFALSEDIQNGATFSFDDADVNSANLDLSGNTFLLQFEDSNTSEVGTISGNFVGVNAEGTIVVFDVRDSDFVNQVTGIKILSSE